MPAAREEENGGHCEDVHSRSETSPPGFQISFRGRDCEDVWFDHYVRKGHLFSSAFRSRLVKLGECEAIEGHGSLVLAAK